MSSLKLLTCVVVFGAVFLLASCSSSTSSSPSAPSEPPATFTDVYAMMFPVTTKGQCNFCHGLPPNEKSNGNLSMGADKATALAALVGKPSASHTCSAATLVVPGDPDASLFFQKLGAAPPCGSRMPLGGDALTAEQLDMVRGWIAAGAKDD